MTMTTVGVVGSGVMGAGIAQVAAVHGCTVAMLDVDASVVRKAIDGIGKRLDRSVEKGDLPVQERARIIDRLHVATGPQAAAACDLVIEAVSENLDAKTQVLEPIVRMAGPGSVFASNTSSLSITQIGRAVSAGRRLAGMHFFNPAPLMPLVEVIAGADTDPAVVDQVADCARAWGKTAVRAKDTPGFIVNRVARGYYLEPLRMLGEGVAGIDEIDRVMRTLGGFRLGPFELMDLVGIDVNYSVTVSVWEQLGRPARLAPHPIQSDLYQRGQLGRKSKRGFYDYDNNPPEPAAQTNRKPFEIPAAVRETLEAFVTRATVRTGSDTENYVFARVLVTIINEAAMAQVEGVATPNDIDTAMRLGTNYPRGPMEWAGQIGVERCGKMLLALNDAVDDDRFAPAALLQR
jgi:3-hydroxybutyryl-CoA dehydrogenase